MTEGNPDRFAELPRYAKRQYVARLLGCDPEQPGGWPHAIIDRLIGVRINQGKREFYEEIGYLISLN